MQVAVDRPITFGYLDLFPQPTNLIEMAQLIPLIGSRKPIGTIELAIHSTVLEWQSKFHRRVGSLASWNKLVSLVLGLFSTGETQCQHP